jgi:hypothetical protein
MHLLEKYSLNCGINPLKLDKPYIYTSYYPIESDKYIVIHPSSGMSSKNYSYYQDVIDFIIENVEKAGYKIVQIGEAKDQHLSGCINLQGKTDIHQTCFIIKNASFFIGNDSFSTHVSSSYGIPSVSLYSTIQPEVSGPYWNNGKQFTIMAPLNGKKPKYSNDDADRVIDKIKPEQILEKMAKAIPEIDTSSKKNLESLFFGKSYPRLSMELVPDSLIEIDKGKDIPLNIRFDYLKSNEISDLNIDSALINLAKRKCGIVTSKVIDIKRFNFDSIKQNISSFIIHIEKKYLKNIDQLIDLIQDLKKIGINARAALVKKNFSEEQLNDLKLKFLNLNQITFLNETSWDECIDKNLNKKIDHLTIFKSSRIIFSKGKNYLSKAAYNEDKPASSIQQRISEIKDLKSLGKELENCYIYNL